MLVEQEEFQWDQTVDNFFGNEQTIDDLVSLQSSFSIPVIEKEVVTTTTIYQGGKSNENAISVTRVPTKTKIPDYTELFSITSHYWEDVQRSMESMSMLPCVCADHGSMSQSYSSFQESSVSLSKNIFSLTETSEEHHDHCDKCGECLKDGKCPKCDHAH